MMMLEFWDQTIADAAKDHGYWVVGVVIMLESMGMLLPGELALVTAAAYAGSTHEMDIGGILAAGILGAVIGDNAGYWLGRQLGPRLLERYGRYVGLTPPRLRLGRYLFAKHGGKVVFFGRFIAVLRVGAGPLAGAYEMGWRRFTLFNACGGVAWVTGYGLAAYWLGDKAGEFAGAMSWVGIVLAVIVVGYGFYLLRRHRDKVQAEADRMFGSGE